MTAPAADTTVVGQAETNPGHECTTPRDAERQPATAFAPPPISLPATGWHIYTVPDLHYGRSLVELIDRCHKVFAGYPQLRPVADERLHATIARVPDAADGFDTATRAALTAELATRLAVLPPLTLTGGSVQVGRDTVVLDLDGDHLDGPWERLAARVADAIERICGPGRLQNEPRPPHLTLATGTRGRATRKHSRNSCAATYAPAAHRCTSTRCTCCTPHTTPTPTQRPGHQTLHASHSGNVRIGLPTLSETAHDHSP